MSNKSKVLSGSVVYRYSLRPNTVYLNITNRCTNRCSFCIKNYSSGLSGYLLELKREPTINEIWREFERGVGKLDREIVWCGFGEPTIRLDTVLEITRKIKKRPFLKVRLDTDGLAQIRYKDREVARELKDAGIDSVSISLNADSLEKYNEICKPPMPRAYRAVLEFTKDCKGYFQQVILTVVNFGGINISKCKKIAEELGCDFKVRG